MRFSSWWVQISIRNNFFSPFRRIKKSPKSFDVIMAINISAYFNVSIFHFEIRIDNNKINFWFYDRLFKHFGISQNNFHWFISMIWSRRSFWYKIKKNIQAPQAFCSSFYLIYSTVRQEQLSLFKGKKKHKRTKFYYAWKNKSLFRSFCVEFLNLRKKKC